MAAHRMGGVVEVERRRGGHGEAAAAVLFLIEETVFEADAGGADAPDRAAAVVVDDQERQGVVELKVVGEVVVVVEYRDFPDGLVPGPGEGEGDVFFPDACTRSARVVGDHGRAAAGRVGCKE